MRFDNGVSFYNSSTRDSTSGLHLGHNLSIHSDNMGESCLLSCTLTTCGWQPLNWVLLEEWPRWDDNDEGESGAGKSDVEGELDVLGDEADKEGESLLLFSQGFPNTRDDILRQ